MKRLGLWVVVAMVTLGALAAAADAATVFKPFPLKWSRGGALKDTVNLASSATNDSVRSASFSLQAVAWDAYAQTGTVSVGIPVTFTTSSASSDTVYFGVELGYLGKWQRVDGIEATAATTSCATGDGGITGAKGGGKIFVGIIDVNPQAWAAANNNVMGKPSMRLFVRNKAGSGTLTGLACTIGVPTHVGLGPFPKWYPKQLKWARATVRDTANIGAAKDSVRTVSIPLDGVDWEALRGGNMAATCTGTVVFVDSVSTMDSLYFAPEVCYKGNCQYLNPLSITATAASAATPAGTSSTQATGDGTIMFGQLQIDPDTYVKAANNLYGKPEFRLHVRGRAAAGSVLGLRCYVILPWLY